MSLYYSEIIFFMIFSLIILQFIVSRNDILSKEKKQQFKILYILVIVSALSEWFGLFLNNKSTDFIFLHGSIKALEYSLVPCLAVFFSIILDNQYQIKRIFLLLIFHALLEFSSIFTHLIFYIDSSNIYQHGHYYWIYMCFYLLSFIYLLYYCLRFSTKHQTQNNIILISTLLLFISGMILRQIHSNIRLDYLFIVLMAIFMYIFYVDVLQKTDALTGLLNRGSYINGVAQISKYATILYFDVNDFKKINDEYGHLYGDEVLQIIGETIKEVYAKYGRTYRIGGDEFCVIIDNQKKDIGNLNNSFHHFLSTKREKDHRIPTVSIGFSYYDYQKNAIEDIIKNADENMYRSKTKYKQEMDNLILKEQKKILVLSQIMQANYFSIDFNENNKIDKIT